MPFEHRLIDLDNGGRLPSGFISSALTGFFILLDLTKRLIWLYTM
jgi:hypothetical protein